MNVWPKPLPTTGGGGGAQFGEASWRSIKLMDSNFGSNDPEKCSVLFVELKLWPIYSHEIITLIFRYTNIFMGYDFGWLPCY